MTQVLERVPSIEAGEEELNAAGFRSLELPAPETPAHRRAVRHTRSGKAVYMGTLAIPRPLEQTAATRDEGWSGCRENITALHVVLALYLAGVYAGIAAVATWISLAVVGP